MWREHIWRVLVSLILGVLVSLRLVKRPELVGRIVNRYPTPDELRNDELVVVQDGDRQKWACLLCPGGCGEKLQLTLVPYRKPRWLVRLDWLRRPSITPSVRQLNDCQCHFWIKGGKVHWCRDSGHSFQAFRRS